MKSIDFLFNSIDLGSNPIDPHLVLRSEPESDGRIQVFKPQSMRPQPFGISPESKFTRVACETRVVMGQNGGHGAFEILTRRFVFIEWLLADLAAARSFSPLPYFISKREPSAQSLSGKICRFGVWGLNKAVFDAQDKIFTP